MTGQFDLKWQPVQASDSSRLLAASQEAAEAYNKAIKDQIKVFDTMFNNAQQHKMNEVQQALNAFSLEDYNAPDARAKFDKIAANATKEIGGFNADNQLTMDTIWDKRGDVLTDRATAQFNLNDAERKDTAAKEKVLEDAQYQRLAGLKYVADNPTGIFTPEQQAGAKADLDEAIAQLYGRNPDGTLINQNTPAHVLGNLAPRLTQLGIDIHKSAADYNKGVDDFNVATYKVAYQGQGSSIIRAKANTAAYLNSLGDSDEDRKVKESLTSTLAQLEEVEKKWLDTLPPAMQNIYRREYNGEYQSVYGTTLKGLQDSRKLSILDYEAQTGRINTNNNFILGSEKNGIDFTLGSERNSIEAANTNAKINGQGAYGNNGSSKKESNWADSFSGSKVSEKEYADLGISNPVTKDVNGNPVLNSDGIKITVNQKLSGDGFYNIAFKGKDGSLDDQYNKAITDPWFSNGSYWLNTGTRKTNFMNGLKKHKYKDPNTNKSRSLTEDEKMYLTVRYVNEKSKGTLFGSAAGDYVYNNHYGLNSKWVNQRLDDYQALVTNAQKQYVQQVIRTVSTDTKLTDGQVIVQLGWDLDDSIRPLLAKSNLDAAKRVRAQNPTPSYTTDRTPSKGAGKTLGKVPQPTGFPKPSPNTSVMTGLPKPTPNSSSNTQKGKGNGGNNNKSQSTPKPTTSSNANSSQGNKKIETGQSGNNWERTKQKYLPDWLR